MSDDTIVMAESADELQAALSAVHQYCETWKLSVNTSKTKVVIFSRGKVRKFPDFLFGSLMLLMIIFISVLLSTIMVLSVKLSPSK